MANCSDDANIMPIMSIVDGYRHSQVLFNAVRLKLFDHLVEQPLSIDELATKLNLPYLATLERFLNGCIALKLLDRDDASGKYFNTPMAMRFLVSTSPATLNGFINRNSYANYIVWSHLDDAIRENAPQWKKVYNIDKEDEFTYKDSVYRNEDEERSFMASMNSLGAASFPSIFAAVDDLSGFKKLCDIGGCNGQLAINACQASPQLEAIVFDLPKMKQHALEYINRAPLAIRNRIHFQDGDFFVDNLPQADLYSLSLILHNWNDEQCKQLLSKIFVALPATNGALLIAEKLLDDDKRGPLTVVTRDLNMLLITNGQERTGKEYTDMLKSVGFKDVKYRQLNNHKDVIIAYKSI